MFKGLALFFLLCFPKKLILDDTPASADSQRHQAKKEIVKTLWIVSGVIMLIFPFVAFIVSLSLFTTFLSFTILDETA